MTDLVDPDGMFDNCNCQAVPGTLVYPGPWHPAGDTPTCPTPTPDTAAPKVPTDLRIGLHDDTWSVAVEDQFGWVEVGTGEPLPAAEVAGWTRLAPVADRTGSGAAALTHDTDEHYRELADAVIDMFNPPDDDVAESAIIVDAIERAAEFIDGQPCLCTPEVTDPDVLATPCARCLALGRRGDRPEER